MCGHDCAFVNMYTYEYFYLPILPLVLLLRVLFYCPLKDVGHKPGETRIVEHSQLGMSTY